MTIKPESNFKFGSLYIAAADHFTCVIDFIPSRQILVCIHIEELLKINVQRPET